MLVRIALMAALIGALGLVPPFFLPVLPGVPITTQNLGVMLAGLVLGARGGAAASGLFVLVVLLGAPLLTGGRGGLGLLAGPTVGFFLGFIPGAFVTGWLAERLRLPAFAGALVAAFAGGVLVLYACGIPALAGIAGLSLRQAALGSAVFLPGDVLKSVAAALLATTVLRPWRVPHRP
ncbi:biotin transporter BioY [Xanthobacter agilis]|uniref:Biotin transporter n=1 Tax=Xanthobacter agilis TaxID=47492 RepID=A0ABU0LGY0_XANAG|nr:biotin transporter BioY [Xanthobacter agilis]MDQ0506394.1 biotin transport system substrate-specific component [Xanthobacter agilis]